MCQPSWRALASSAGLSGGMGHYLVFDCGKANSGGLPKGGILFQLGLRIPRLRGERTGGQKEIVDIAVKLSAEPRAAGGNRAANPACQNPGMRFARAPVYIAVVASKPAFMAAA